MGNGIYFVFASMCGQCYMTPHPPWSALYLRVQIRGVPPANLRWRPHCVEAPSSGRSHTNVVPRHVSNVSYRYPPCRAVWEPWNEQFLGCRWYWFVLGSRLVSRPWRYDGSCRAHQVPRSKDGRGCSSKGRGYNGSYWFAPGGWRTLIGRGRGVIIGHGTLCGLDSLITVTGTDGMVTVNTTSWLIWMSYFGVEHHFGPLEGSAFWIYKLISMFLSRQTCNS